jgi:hypothetical protein
VTFLRVALVSVPIAAMTLAIPFVNRIEPRVLGLPFLLFWIACWVLITPACLWVIGRLEKRW